jgi:A/G-specific adenine glycosylase
VQADLPARAPKRPKPTRHGIAYLGRREDGAWLVERRPNHGLLGGMLGWPGGEWGDTADDQPPAQADWRDPGVEVRHTFTHFHLHLGLRIATLPLNCQPETGDFIAHLRPSDLPTVMRKAHDLARAALDSDGTG